MDTNSRIFQIALMVIACFSIGSVGFFLAVFLEHNVQKSDQNPQQIQVLQLQKNAAMQSLSASESTSSATIVSTSSPFSTSTAQAASNDQNASAKLQVLENLNQK